MEQVPRMGSCAGKGEEWCGGWRGRCRGRCQWRVWTRKSQIPPDLVVKRQALDIAEIIL